MYSYIFLFIIGFIGLLSKNKILFYSALILVILKLVPNSQEILPKYKSSILRFGIFIITLAILIPIASEQIGFKELGTTLESREGIIALLVGIFASILATKGIFLQTIQPQIVVFVSLGVALGVMFIGGTPVGPIVASGLTYIVLKIIERVI